MRLFEEDGTEILKGDPSENDYVFLSGELVDDRNRGDFGEITFISGENVGSRIRWQRRGPDVFRSSGPRLKPFVKYRGVGTKESYRITYHGAEDYVMRLETGGDILGSDDLSESVNQIGVSGRFIVGITSDSFYLIDTDDIGLEEIDMVKADSPTGSEEFDEDSIAIANGVVAAVPSGDSDPELLFRQISPNGAQEEIDSPISGENSSRVELSDNGYYAYVDDPETVLEYNEESGEYEEYYTPGEDFEPNFSFTGKYITVGETGDVEVYKNEPGNEFVGTFSVTEPSSSRPLTGFSWFPDDTGVMSWDQGLSTFNADRYTHYSVSEEVIVERFSSDIINNTMDNEDVIGDQFFIYTGGDEVNDTVKNINWAFFQQNSDEGGGDNEVGSDEGVTSILARTDRRAQFMIDRGSVEPDVDFPGGVGNYIER